MNIHEEGKYYAAMVRKFRTEYKSRNLHGFCKDQKVSYTKMLHCLRNESYRKPTVESVPIVEEQGLHPLVVEAGDNVPFGTSKLPTDSFDSMLLDDVEFISWESFVYLVEGTVLSDRKVAFSDLDSENDDETDGKINEEDLANNAFYDSWKRVI